jgi:hypothetical protein
MIEKIVAACKDARVSDQFVMCTDDTFLKQDIWFSDLKGWHEGPMLYDAPKDLAEHRSVGIASTSVNPSRWFDYVYATGRELKLRGLPDNNYDRAHCPQPIDKSDFLRVIKTWDYRNNNYTNSNLYLNSSSVFSGENISGRNGKIYNPMPEQSIFEYLKDKVVFNVNDNGLTNTMRDILQCLFPDTSEYEIFNHSADKRKLVQEWFQNGCNYQHGLSIFIQFAPRNLQLIRFLEKKVNTNIGIIKLKSTLRLWLR